MPLTYFCGLLRMMAGILSLIRSLFTSKEAPVPASIYDFRFDSVNGGIIDFSQFKGKKILIVNTASKCGLTPQYKALQALYEAYKAKLVIVAFPANNFLFQEPGSNEQIADFCSNSYHISFPVATKISVRGWKMAPIYLWLTKNKYNGFRDSVVKWNFQKYLINERGQLIAVFDPKTLPGSPEVIAAIEGK